MSGKQTEQTELSRQAQAAQQGAPAREPGPKDTPAAKKSTRRRPAGAKAAEAPPPEPSEQPSDVTAPAMERAQVMLDDTGKRIGEMAWHVGWRLRKAAALVREEAEDIWAEAQSIRQRVES